MRQLHACTVKAKTSSASWPYLTLRAAAESSPEMVAGAVRVAAVDRALPAGINSPFFLLNYFL